MLTLHLTNFNESGCQGRARLTRVGGPDAIKKNQTVNTARRLLPVLLLLSLFHSSQLHGQDSVKVIIVSPRVGREVDAGEREHFKVFTRIVGFDHAVFYQRTDSSYVAHVVYQSGRGVINDTLIEFSRVQLTMLAEKINHLEGMENGTYHFGDDPPKLTYEDGSLVSVKRVDSPQTPSAAAIVHLSEILPLVPDSISEQLLDEPSACSIGIGLSWYSPDYAGLIQAYHAVEQKYLQQGYDVGKQEPAFGTSTLLWLDFGIRFTDNTRLILSGGTQLAGSVDFKAATAVLRFSFLIPEIASFHPYVDVGVGHFRISCEQKYGASVGGYATLDGLLIDASSTGFSFAFGVGGGTATNWNIYVGYQSIPTVHQSTTLGTDATIAMSSVVMGVGLSLPW